MRIAVLGAGAGGTAAAFDCASHGHEVRLFDFEQFPENIVAVAAQPQLEHRYLNEDVGYGLVFMSQLGKKVGVETPTMDAVIQLASVLMARDYAAEAPRTPDSLGIGDLALAELRDL